MNTALRSYLKVSGTEKETIPQNIDRSMTVVGRTNVENSKWAIKAIVRTLQYAIKEYGVPATVTHFLSPKYPYDLAIRPLPGATFKPAGINSLYWTNTAARHGGMYWSREFGGWRAWPKERPDKALGLGVWVDRRDPYDQSHAWVAVTTRATSDDDSLLCRWAPMSDVMQYYARTACLPLSYLTTCPGMIYDAKTKRFDLSPDLLRQILGIKGASS